MAVITIKPTGEQIVCEDGTVLLSALLNQGVFVDNPCNGNGVCGKCKVRIHGNDGEDIRLSCMVKVFGNMEVELLQRERKHRVLTKGYLPEFERDSFDDGYGVAMDIGTTTVVMALIDLRTGEEIASASDINAQKHYGLDVLTRITYEYEHGDDGVKALQTAIVDSLNEMIEAMCREADEIVSRTIGVGEGSPDCDGDDICGCRAKIREIVVAANCTMTHMLLGVDARSIGRAPYAPVFTEAQKCPAAEIGLKAGTDTVLYCLPQVSSYIGADIVAGAYVCELEKENGNVLFIDIGTNGEIVLASRGKILSCSCAAGPALEGMNISCGMRAAEGAVEEIQMSESGIELKTIGNAAPAGLCGSGILAAVRELIGNGFLKKTGAFVNMDSLDIDDWRRRVLRNAAVSDRKREVVFYAKNGIPEPEIVVTQDDVRQVQLAKGAILSGFTVLLKKAGLEMDDLDKVFIAGQFGAHLSAESLVGVGILPEKVKNKLVYVGNSSKTGAYMALLSRKVRREMEELAGKMEYFELAQTKDYERVFAEAMRFPVR